MIKSLHPLTDQGQDPAGAEALYLQIQTSQGKD